MKILITGVAGFIGFSLAKTLLAQNHYVYGIDNLNNYYDVRLKKKRLLFLRNNYKNKFIFSKIDISVSKKINKYFTKKNFDKVFHFAAQAGVRYSLTHPEKYLNSNLVGFSNVIFNCKRKKIKNFIYASSSSVYGGIKKIPFRESDKVSSPLQYYAATKISNEAIAESYSKLYKIKCTGLRFFTVYGPWGRPDMALFSFVKNIFNNKFINVYNKGNHFRDFTYIDDAIRMTIKVSKSNKYFNTKNYHRILNIGTGNPVPLKKYLNIIENEVGKKAKIKYLKIQKGDMIKTYACVKRLKSIVDINKRVSLKKGISNFVEWYKNYYTI
jgi:UDP-glucuronate 4-epimerase